MAVLTWDSPGSRYFEVGVDRGVIYPNDTNIGVAWNGLTNVTHSRSNGDIKPYYLDGRKFYHETGNEDLDLKVDAYTYPEEFARCDGTAFGENGLAFDLQPRTPFGLSYRTLIGNDVDGQSHGYKIHLIYNALASPTEEAYETLSDDLSPMTLSWDLSTLSPIGSAAPAGYKNTPHVYIDSTKTHPLILKAIEDILYGTSTKNPRLPTQVELINEFGKGLLLIVENQTTGLSRIQNGTPSDLKGHITDGVFESTSTTRLAKTNSTGVYDLE